MVLFDGSLVVFLGFQEEQPGGVKRPAYVERFQVETKSVAPNPSNPSNTVDIQAPAWAQRSVEGAGTSSTDSTGDH